MKFDGRKLAREIEERVKARVSEMEKKPKIVSVLVGSDPASELYTRLKKEMAERVGIDFVIHKINGMQHTAYGLQEEIKKIGERADLDGVMMQMPIPGVLRGRTPKLLEGIPLEKDVDGLRWEESGVMPATVRAILSILQQIANRKIQNNKLQIINKSQIQNINNKIGENFWEQKFVVVGDRGSVGRPLMHYLQKRGVKNLVGVNSETDQPARTVLAGEVVISCVGKAGVVMGDQVQENAIVIDVGAPKGDMTPEVYEKASVSVEVPGGVGPVTIVSLMENIVEMRKDV